jgi:dTDP-glucose pyrophosphorylase
MTTAIILAGGESSRLRPLGDKSLQRFMGQTLLRRHVETIARAGYTNTVIVTGPRNDADIRLELAQLPAAIALRYITQPEPLGMGDAAVRARCRGLHRFGLSHPGARSV